MKYDELRALRDAAPEDAEIEVFYPGDRDSWAQTAPGVSAFYTAAYTAIPALLDENDRLRTEREALMSGLGLDPDTPDAHTPDEMRREGVTLLWRIESLESDLARLRAAARAFAEQRTEAALIALMSEVER